MKDMRERMQEVTEGIGLALRAKASLGITLSHLEADLAGRKKFLVPLNGWLADQPKSTVDQRTVAAERAYAADEVCQKITAQIVSAQDDLAREESDLAALQVQFQGMRWAIRDRLNDILAKGAQLTEESSFEGKGFTEAEDDAAFLAAQAATQSPTDREVSEEEAQALVPEVPSPHPQPQEDQWGDRCPECGLYNGFHRQPCSHFTSGIEPEIPF